MGEATFLVLVGLVTLRNSAFLDILNDYYNLLGRSYFVNIQDQVK